MELKYKIITRAYIQNGTIKDSTNTIKAKGLTKCFMIKPPKSVMPDIEDQIWRQENRLKNLSTNLSLEGFYRVSSCMSVLGEIPLFDKLHQIKEKKAWMEIE